MSRLSLVLPAALLVLLAAAPSQAQTGVDDDRVSLPEGPGSLEGVGDNADVDPNMGLMRWALPIEALRGQGALTPQLQLGYSSGGGSGIVGMGWSLSMPSVERWTARGVPSYTASDRLAVGGGEELVEVGSEGGAGPRAVTSAGAVMRGYDASGRLTSRGAMTLERDYQVGSAELRSPAEAAGVYGYVASNPLNTNDPLGLKGKSVKSKGKEVTKKGKKSKKSDGGDGGDNANPGGPGGAPASAVAGSGSGASWTRGEVQGARAESGVQIGARSKTSTRETNPDVGGGLGGQGTGGGGSGSDVFAKIGKAVLPHRARGKEGDKEASSAGKLVSLVGLLGVGATVGAGIVGGVSFGEEEESAGSGDDPSGITNLYGR